MLLEIRCAYVQVLYRTCTVHAMQIFITFALPTTHGAKLRTLHGLDGECTSMLRRRHETHGPTCVRMSIKSSDPRLYEWPCFKPLSGMMRV